MSRPPLRLGSLHYAWIVAATTFVVLIVVAGIRATPGVLMVPIERDMGWSAQTISAAAAINIALFGLVGPFAAALMQTFGLRRTMVLGLVVVTAGVSAAGFSREPWQLILTWGVIAGIGLGMLAMVLAATVANRWFVAQRGLVTGALTAATAFPCLRSSRNSSAGATRRGPSRLRRRSSSFRYCSSCATGPNKSA